MHSSTCTCISPLPLLLLLFFFCYLIQLHSAYGTVHARITKKNMSYRLLFAPDGGGWARRAYQFKKDYRELVSSTPDVEKYFCPISLYDFKRPNDAIDARRIQKFPYDNKILQEQQQQEQHKKQTEYKQNFFSKLFVGSDRSEDRWRVSDDRIIGGYSESQCFFVQTEHEALESLQQRNENDRDGNNTDDPIKNELLKLEMDSMISEFRKEKNPEDNSSTIEIKDETIQKENDDFQNKELDIPFIRWVGKIDTMVGMESDVQRSGFSAIRAPNYRFLLNDGADLQGNYNAIEIYCRSNDHRIYTLNVMVSSLIPGDIYQAKFNPTNHVYRSLGNKSSYHNYLNLPKQYDDWKEEGGRVEPDIKIPRNLNNVPFQRVVIPFEKLTVTMGGREREFHRVLDDNVVFESVGVVLMDNTDGEFVFDLARIRAVNVNEDGRIHGDDIYDYSYRPPTTNAIFKATTTKGEFNTNEQYGILNPHEEYDHKKHIRW